MKRTPMVRNTTLAVLALLVASATAQAGLIASVVKQVNGGNNAFPYNNATTSTWGLFIRRRS